MRPYRINHHMCARQKLGHFHVRNSAQKPDSLTHDRGLHVGVPCLHEGTTKAMKESE